MAKNARMKVFESYPGNELELKRAMVTALSLVYCSTQLSEVHVMACFCELYRVC